MDTAQFEAGARKAKATAGGLQGALGGFTKSFGAVAGGAAVGTAAVAAFTYGMNLATAALENADALSAAATKIGVTAEALQGLRFAAEDADIPITAMDSGLSALNATLGALKTGIGDGKIRKAFEALGIPDSQLKSMVDATDLLPVLADKISEVGTQAEQVQIAKKLGVEELLPLLQRGSTGIKDLTDRARELGLVMDEQVVTSLADMSREMEIADGRLKMASLRLGAELTPALVATKNWLAEAADGFRLLYGEITKGLPELNKFIDRIPVLNAFRKYSGLEALGGAFNYIRGNNAPTVTPGQMQALLEGKKKPTIPELPKPEPDAPIRSRRGSSGTAPEETQAQLFAQAQGYNDRARERLADEKLVSDFKKTVIDPGSIRETIAESAAIGLGEGLDRSRADIRDGYRSSIEQGLYAAVHGGGKGLMQFLGDQLKNAMISKFSDKASGWAADKAGGLFSRIASSFGRNANGTSNWRGGLTWVGERGKELVNLPGGSQVIPNHQLGSLTPARPVQNFHINAAGAVLAADLMSEMRQVGAQAYSRSVAESERRAPGAVSRNRSRRG